jgi:hypothetical protein
LTYLHESFTDHSTTTVDAGLKLFGILQANCEILYPPNSFVGREIFEHWGMEMFVPEVTTRRRKTRYESLAVLILDGCMGNDGDAFWDLCMEHSIASHIKSSPAL